jgi:hypothetical protein
VHTREPLGHSAGQLGQAEVSSQKPNSNKKMFSFSKLFYKLQINLNSNQI